MEVKRQLDVLDRRLAESEYLAGDDYTIADIAVWPWYGALAKGLLYERRRVPAGAGLQERAALDRRRSPQRPAVKRGRMVNRTCGRAGEPAARAPRRQRLRHQDAGQAGGDGVIGRQASRQASSHESVDSRPPHDRRRLHAEPDAHAASRRRHGGHPSRRARSVARAAGAGASGRCAVRGHAGAGAAACASIARPQALGRPRRPGAGAAAGVCAVLAGRRGADVPGRGAAAHPRRGHARRPHPRQDRQRRLAARMSAPARRCSSTPPPGACCSPASWSPRTAKRAWAPRCAASSARAASR